MAFQSFASEAILDLSGELPVEVQRFADKQYELIREDPFHPSLHVKQVGEVWTVRVGQSHRAIGYRDGDISAGAGSAPTKRTASFCGG